MSEHCPTCGAPVRVVSGDEGTSHYEPREWTIFFGNDGPDWAVEGHNDRAFPEVPRVYVVEVES